MSNLKTIKEIRRHIDRLDVALINILAERMSLIPDIAKQKKEYGIPIFQEKREQQIMKRLLNIASEQGLDKGFVEEVFLSIFNEAKRIQHYLIEKK